MRQSRLKNVSSVPEAGFDAIVHPDADFQWRLVLENTIVGISYMQDRRFLWANARMAEIFRYRPGELDGELVRKLYVTQEDYDEVGRLIAGFSRDGFYTHERAMACKDGALIWCRISGRLLHGHDAHASSVWVVQDLSDRKRAEDELRRINQHLEYIVEKRTANLRRTNTALEGEIKRRKALQATSAASSEKYRTLFRHLPLGVLVLDAKNEVIEANRTFLACLGATSRARLTDLMNDASRVVLHNGRTTSLFRLLRRRTAARLDVERFELSWVRAPERVRHFAVIGAPLASVGRGVVFTFADVTENLRQRERELEQQAALTHASRLSLMGQMTSALAHELGQPLNACQSYLSGMRLRLDARKIDGWDFEQALEKASTHLEQAAQIIRNVRAFVSRHKPVFESVDLTDLVDRILLLLQPQVRASGVQVKVVSVAPDGALPNAHCNSIEIQQVLMNLLINSIDAMEEASATGRRITVRIAVASRETLNVEVRDSGPGVPESLIPRLCEPYVTTKPAGLGMGLMICRTIVEAHGGCLRYIPRRGRGATFRFTLPVCGESHGRP